MECMLHICTIQVDWSLCEQAFCEVVKVNDTEIFISGDCMKFHLTQEYLRGVKCLILAASRLQYIAK
jgi:hypothetical protein